MKQSPISPRQGAKRLAEISEQKRAVKAARKAARVAKAAANPKTHKAPPITEHTGRKRRLRQVCHVIIRECDLGIMPSGDPVTMADLNVTD